MKNIKLSALLVVFAITNITVYAQEQKEDFFAQFVLRFARDSAFQMQRVKFPLPYETWDSDNGKDVVLTITKDRYHITSLNLAGDYDDSIFTTFFDSFEADFNRDSDEMVYKCWGMSDMDLRYYFRRIEGKWFLVKISSPDPLE